MERVERLAEAGRVIVALGIKPRYIQRVTAAFRIVEEAGKPATEPQCPPVIASAVERINTTGRHRRDRVAPGTGRMRGSCPNKARTIRPQRREGPPRRSWRGPEAGNFLLSRRQSIPSCDGATNCRRVDGGSEKAARQMKASMQPLRLLPRGRRHSRPRERKPSAGTPQFRIISAEANHRNGASTWAWWLSCPWYTRADRDFRRYAGDRGRPVEARRHLRFDRIDGK